LAAPCTGKSVWLSTHSTEWEDADIVMGKLGLHSEEWHLVSHTSTEEREHYEKIDSTLYKLKRDGRKIIGSLFWDYIPDGIVSINETTHRTYCSKRSDIKWDYAKQVDTVLKQIAERYNVPVFNSFDSAVKIL